MCGCCRDVVCFLIRQLVRSRAYEDWTSTASDGRARYHEQGGRGGRTVHIDRHGTAALFTAHESIALMKYLRRLPKFEYLTSRSIDEACDLLAAHANEVRLLAGGTDLLLQMRRRETCPAYILGLKV